MKSEHSEYTFTDLDEERAHGVLPRVYLAPPRLRRYLDTYFVTESTSALPTAERARRMPEGASYISFLRGRMTASGVRDDAVLLVGGAQDGIHHIPAWDYQFQCGLRIQPGAARIVLGRAAPAAANSIVPLRDLWGEQADRLFERLLSARGDADHVQIISHAIEALLCTQSHSDTLSVQLATAVRGAPGNARIAQLARELGTTVRTLERRFKEEVGLTPKRYQRISRLAHVIRLLEHTSDWSRIAAECGYCDQAHLIDDCQEVLGQTPERFLRSVTKKVGLRIGLVFEKEQRANF